MYLHLTQTGRISLVTCVQCQVLSCFDDFVQFIGFGLETLNGKLPVGTSGLWLMIELHFTTILPLLDLALMSCNLQPSSSFFLFHLKKKVLFAFYFFEFFLLSVGTTWYSRENMKYSSDRYKFFTIIYQNCISISYDIVFFIWSTVIHLIFLKAQLKNYFLLNVTTPFIFLFLFFQF